MADTMKEFDKPEFSVEKYTKQLLKDCVGGTELQQRRKELQQYNDQTAATLKRSVYANYMQFIETAKEVSNLESEMYQLSHILIEQRNILATLDEKSAAATAEEQAEQTAQDAANDRKTTLEDEQNNYATRAVKELVKGYKGNLEGKTFLHEGALIELDANDYRPVQRVFFFLFNDVLIVSKVKHDKRLEFVAEYHPRKIAVINIKDLDGVKNAINIITSDGSKIFQSFNAAGKTEWIEKLEVAFRFEQQQQQQKANKTQKKSQAPQPPNRSKQSPQSSVSPSSANSKQTLQSNDATLAMENKENEETTPEWLTTASEEIQTLIAQRYFEDAHVLIKRAREYFLSTQKQTNSSTPTTTVTTTHGTVIKSSIKKLESSLADVLLLELSNSHCRNLQVTLRSSRRSLLLLVDMGRTREACNTLLKVCTVALRTAQREARRNNAEISELFFCDLAQVACEFMSAFETKKACVSALVVWCNSELQHFASQLIKHYLTKGTTLETVAKCIEGIRQPCAKLTEIGLDLSYHLEGLLLTTLNQLIADSRGRLLETARSRNEEQWQPYNLQTKSNLKRLLFELDALGIDMRAQTTGDTWINLTQSVVMFTRHFLQVTEYCASLSKIEALSQNLEFLLRDLLLAQLSINPPTGISVDPNFVAKNKRFLQIDLLTIVIKKFKSISGHESKILLELQLKLRKDAAPVPKQRSVYQTDVF